MSKVPVHDGRERASLSRAAGICPEAGPGVSTSGDLMIYGLSGRRYRGTSLIRDSAALEPYSRAMPRALWWS